MTALRMVPVATTPTTFEASVIAALLGAEGIVWQLRGADGVYPVGRVDVLVGEADEEAARELLAAGSQPVDGAGAEADELDEPAEGAEVDGRAPLGLWLVLAAVVLAGVSTFVRAVLHAT